MFIAALFIIAQKWKQCIGAPTDVEINKKWHIHTMEYYFEYRKER